MTTQPLSQRLIEEASRWNKNGNSRSFGAYAHSPELQGLLMEAAQLAKRVESAAIHEVEPDGCLDLYLGEYFANKRVALVTLEEP